MSEGLMAVSEAHVALLLLLGAVHGINPAMGWLFAVSLGLQEQSSRAVWRALGPLALGHALAIAAAHGAAAVLGLVLPPTVVRALAAAALLAFGIMQLTRHRHPRAGGIRVNARELTLWSFLMASAHGAGLMVLPVVLELDAHAAHATHGAPLLAGVHAGAGSLLATLLHTAGYLAVAGALAWIVYDKLGLRLLRTAWININVIWAAALIVTAVLTLLL